MKTFIYLSGICVTMSKMLTIYEALLNRKEKICHKSEIIGIIKEYNQFIGKINAQNALWYLSRHRYIKRVIFDFYYINSLDERERNFCNYEGKELLFTAMNKLGIKWYVGLNYALYLLGKTWQTPNTLMIINSKLSGNKQVLGMNVKFTKIKENLIFGLKEGITKNKVRYFYSDLAKTYIDLAYFKRLNKMVKVAKTKQYSRRYPKWLRKLI